MQYNTPLILKSLKDWTVAVVDSNDKQIKFFKTFPKAIEFIDRHNPSNYPKYLDNALYRDS